MRKSVFRGSPALGRALLERATELQIASTDGAGAPILRTVHPVLIDEYLVFHSARVGAKVAVVGRPAVVAASETVATIPSYFFDPERACPATTYYLSVHVEGVIESVDDPADKARALRAFMDKYQPEGGFEDISADSPLYQKSIDSLLIARISLATLSCKAKLGQNRSLEERRRALELLWKRGLPDDSRAIDLILEHSPRDHRDELRPEFLRAPEWHMHCHLDDELARAASELVVNEYWNVGIPLETLVTCHQSSIAWVGAQTRDGRLIGTARAIGDRAKFATILDVAVAADWRGKGVGRSLIALLLDHPNLRAATRLSLRTRDAMSFYEGFGFDSRRPMGAEYVEMYLRRPAS